MKKAYYLLFKVAMGKNFSQLVQNIVISKWLKNSKKNFFLLWLECSRYLWWNKHHYNHNTQWWKNPKHINAYTTKSKIMKDFVALLMDLIVLFKFLTSFPIQIPIYKTITIQTFLPAHYFWKPFCAYMLAKVRTMEKKLVH